MPGKLRSPETNLSPRTVTFTRLSLVATVTGRYLANVIAQVFCSASGSLPSESGIFRFCSLAIRATSSCVMTFPPSLSSRMLLTADSWICAVMMLSALAAGGLENAANWPASDFRATIRRWRSVVCMWNDSG